MNTLADPQALAVFTLLPLLLGTLPGGNPVRVVAWPKKVALPLEPMIIIAPKELVGKQAAFVHCRPVYFKVGDKGKEIFWQVYGMARRHCGRHYEGKTGKKE